MRRDVGSAAHHEEAEPAPTANGPGGAVDQRGERLARRPRGSRSTPPRARQSRHDAGIRQRGAPAAGFRIQRWRDRPAEIEGDREPAARRRSGRDRAGWRRGRHQPEHPGGPHSRPGARGRRIEVLPDSPHPGRYRGQDRPGRDGQMRGGDRRDDLRGRRSPGEARVMPYWCKMKAHELVRVAALATLVLVIGACSTSAQQARQPSPGEIVATVGGVSITLEQVDEKALQEPAESFGSLKLSQALYEARRARANEMIGNVLLDQEAKRRGIERAALVEQEITSNAAPVTEADVAAWYQSNPQRVQGATLDQVRAPIKSMLAQERIQNVRDVYLNTLKAKTTVRVMLDPPRAAVRAGTSPAKGPAGAPIELIEFADFQC